MNRLIQLLLLLLLIVHSLFVTSAWAQATRRNAGNQPIFANEPADLHHSFVRDANRRMVADDVQYALDVRGRVGAGSVDIVMAQCYGGGFVNDIHGMGRPYTFASASAWNECARSGVIGPPGGNVTFLENFTRSWRKSADLFPTLGMLNHFRIAAGDGVVTVPPTADPKDRYAPPGKMSGGVLRIEHPQYASPDVPVNNPDGSIGGVNNTRTLTAPPPDAQGPHNQYAILVAWSQMDNAVATRDRFAVNIARMNKTLMAVNGAPVPLRNIVVLYGNTARGTNLGPFNAIKGEGDAVGENLPTFFVDGPNNRQNWLNALSGGLFVNANNQLGIQYRPGDQLFIYNTGHGGSQDLQGPPAPMANGLRFNIELANGFDTRPDDPEAPGSLTGLDGMDLLQISTRRLIGPGVQLAVNGAGFGELSSYLVTDPSLPYDLGDFVVGTTFTYQIQIPHSLLGVDLVNALIDLTGLSAFDATPDLVAAFDFRGGDQELLVVIGQAPAPGGLALLLLGLGALVAIRQKRTWGRHPASEIGGAQPIAG